MRTITANTPFQTPNDKIALQVSTTPATLSYSVDNKTYTKWNDQITENNAVITNCPIGLYMKLDVDCIITD